MQFGLLCFATFVFDTLDACTRLARYVFMELTGWKGKQGMMTATLVTLALPVFVLTLPPATLNGQTLPLWRVFWNLFGSSNQLLAALALLSVSVWIAHKGKRCWVTLAPASFMLAMTIWSLTLSISQHLKRIQSGNAAMLHHVEFVVAVLLLALGLWLVGEAWLVLRGRRILKAAEPVPIGG
jgi:carbon starvation protein